MSKLYFGPEIDEAIGLYQNEVNKKKRDEIFEHKIKPAFEKFISFHYYRMPVTKNPEVMIDCLSYLTEKIPKFNPTHERGFPYFNVITRNFFIQKLKAQKRILPNEQENSNLPSFAETCAQRVGVDLLVAENFELQIEKKEFYEILIEQLPKWKEQFSKEQEKIFIDALITLFNNIDNIHIYNKKACLFYLREITGLNSKQVAANLNKVRKKFEFLKKRYQKGDI